MQHVLSDIYIPTREEDGSAVWGLGIYYISQHVCFECFTSIFIFTDISLLVKSATCSF